MDLLAAAVRQSAIDCGCRPEDFWNPAHTLVRSRPDSRARCYLDLPHVCNFVTYGAGIVASAGEPYLDIAAQVLQWFPPEGSPYRLFETPSLHRVDEAFAAVGARTCFMAEYFLPQGRLVPAECPLEIRVLDREALGPLHLPQWRHALSLERPELDILGIGAFDGETLAALAACSADCDGMWQIGIDVLPAYRRRGIAVALTGRLTLEILDRGRVPFYCAAWSNLASVRNALAAGFRPAWVELTVKTREFVEKCCNAP